MQMNDYMKRDLHKWIKSVEEFMDFQYIPGPEIVLSEQLFSKGIYSNEQHIIIIAVHYRLLLHRHLK